MTALALDDITCRFAARDGGEPYTAVANTTLAVAKGEFVSVVGPTGCGKSTLLNVAAGLLEPSSGNTGIALELVAKLKGYPLTCVLPANATEERRQLLRLYGARIVESPGSG